jgi:hypothetical protein
MRHCLARDDYSAEFIELQVTQPDFEAAVAACGRARPVAPPTRANRIDRRPPDARSFQVWLGSQPRL